MICLKIRSCLKIILLLGVLFPVRGNPFFAPGSPSRCCWLPGLSGCYFRSCRGLPGWSGCRTRSFGGLPGWSGCRTRSFGGLSGLSGCRTRSFGGLPEQSGCHFRNCRGLYFRVLCNSSKIQALEGLINKGSVPKPAPVCNRCAIRI